MKPRKSTRFAPRRAQCLLPPLDSACGLCAGAGKVSDDDPPQAWPRSRPARRRSPFSAADPSARGVRKKRGTQLSTLFKHIERGLLQVSEAEKYFGRGSQITNFPPPTVTHTHTQIDRIDKLSDDRVGRAVGDSYPMHPCFAFFFQQVASLQRFARAAVAGGRGRLIRTNRAPRSRTNARRQCLLASASLCTCSRP